MPARDELLTPDEQATAVRAGGGLTIPAEYIMMMHYSTRSIRRWKQIAVYCVRTRPSTGGWPLYYGGELNISCTVKAYYALKLVGDSPDAPHMVRARKPSSNAAAPARAKRVHADCTRAVRAGAMARGSVYPRRNMLMPRWFPVNLYKVSYWSRTVMVPLFILVHLQAQG